MCATLFTVFGAEVPFFFLGGGDGDLLESLELAASLLEEDGLGCRLRVEAAAGDFL
jgi:hypothetical protein